MNTVKMSPVEAGGGYRELIAAHGSPLLILDSQTVRGQVLNLRRALPEVDLYYAVKSLPHPAMVRLMASMGVGFDIASSGEIELLRDLSQFQRQMIHTHPIKRDQDIRDALRFGCTTFVVDNPDELTKFLPYRHRVGLLLRVSFRSAAAVVDLSKKFGCAVEDVPGLLALATQLGVYVKGLSFHVGSQCRDGAEQVKAIHACNTLIRQHHDTGAAPLSILDIGGGFPVAYDEGDVDIERYCAPIRDALSALPPHVSVIAEPGRYISGPSMTCVTTVIGRAIRSGMRWYYMDDGVYGSFSGQIFDHVRYPLEIFSDDKSYAAGVLAGPTCDSIDLIAEDIELPELRIGDVIVGHMMGAYTAASATEFNSLKKANILVINEDGVSEPAVPLLCDSDPVSRNMHPLNG